MKVYFISGLGADKRIFKHIQLPFSFDTIHLDWINPLQRESLEAYAIRMSESINTTEPFALVGLSMGGMIACEIAKRFPPVALILISSVPTSNQLPGYFKIAYRLNLHKLVPVRMLKAGSLMKRFFTAEDSEDKKIIRQVILETDPAFIKWAITAILEWQNDVVPESTCHIHGSKDEILPARYTTPTYTIDAGTHMMVMTKAAQINRLIENILQPYVALK